MPVSTNACNTHARRPCTDLPHHFSGSSRLPVIHRSTRRIASHSSWTMLRPFERVTAEHAPVRHRFGKLCGNVKSLISVRKWALTSGGVLYPVCEWHGIGHSRTDSIPDTRARRVCHVGDAPVLTLLDARFPVTDIANNRSCETIDRARAVE